MKTKIEIKTFGGSVLFEYKSENNTLKETLEKAVEDGAYLDGANLRGAYLRGANLDGANLRGANLRGANLRGANLDGANLRGAYLDGANLRGAYLDGAYLDGANLRGANLDGANLRGAYLRGANLDGANLRGANLRGANLETDLREVKNLPESFINECSRDILFILEHLRPEVPFLRKKLLAGEVDGTQYTGTCACLIGTLANGDGGLEKVCSAIPFYEKGTHNPGELWFLNIKLGDTPENNFFAKHALKLIDMVLKEPKRSPGRPKTVKKRKYVKSGKYAKKKVGRPRKR